MPRKRQPSTQPRASQAQRKAIKRHQRLNILLTTENARLQAQADSNLQELSTLRELKASFEQAITCTAQTVAQILNYCAEQWVMMDEEKQIQAATIRALEADGQWRRLMTEYAQHRIGAETKVLRGVLDGSGFKLIPAERVVQVLEEVGVILADEKREEGREMEEE
ncbi:hypothetical protein P152DRAFT_479153 [Eremomyces bilateralis CBS 781.70]|uniref:Uncharacterized protein n=1 Tax=Eremomyces bilateralis CBS 781.70 TaxID=1392243 RepID=A0A6G1GFM3_9PEZI|nr:uncharacterized protein P152DRAFT_479153 [Eremomyces bilateralis CBS 781.70]KAF1816650.1 hypothetical protein P152DRAFT_479153 [Eremomyces bilateralis CBS 781.70]